MNQQGQLSLPDPILPIFLGLFTVVLISFWQNVPFVYAAGFLVGLSFGLLFQKTVPMYFEYEKGFKQ